MNAIEHYILLCIRGQLITSEFAFKTKSKYAFSIPEHTKNTIQYDDIVG